MSAVKTVEELEKEKKERQRRFSVSRRKSAEATPEEQKRIIDAFCQQFKGILQDKGAIPTIDQVVEHLEKTQGIKRDFTNRRVSVPRYNDPTQIEQAVYAAVWVLMATNASSLVSPSGGQPRELFALATALIACNAAIAKEQIDTVVASLEAGKSGLPEKDQKDLAVIIALNKLNSELITQSHLQGKQLSGQERRDALQKAIETGNTFSEPAAKAAAKAMIRQCDDRFLTGSNQLTQPVVAASAAQAPSEPFSAAAEAPILEPAPKSEAKDPEVKGGAPIEGAAPPHDPAKAKEEVVEGATMQRRSANVGGQPQNGGMGWFSNHLSADSGQEMKLDVDLSTLSKEGLEAYHKRLGAEVIQYGKERDKVMADYDKAKAAGQDFDLLEKLKPINAKKDTLAKYAEKYEAEVNRRAERDASPAP